MKLKNLTIGKIKEICKSKKGCPKTCPLKDHQWCCLGLRNMTTKELEEGEIWKTKYAILEKEHIELMLENGALKKIVEIIKNKEVNVATLICIINTSDDVNDYNKVYVRRKLTQDEFDLLKEVLGDDI